MPSYTINYAHHPFYLQHIMRSHRLSSISITFETHFNLVSKLVRFSKSTTKEGEEKRKLYAHLLKLTKKCFLIKSSVLLKMSKSQKIKLNLTPNYSFLYVFKKHEFTNH